MRNLFPTKLNKFFNLTTLSNYELFHNPFIKNSKIKRQINLKVNKNQIKISINKKFHTNGLNLNLNR